MNDSPYLRGPAARGSTMRAQDARPARQIRPQVLTVFSGLLLVLGPVHCQAGILWEEGWNVRANGQYLSVEPFTSSMPVDRVARELAARDARYERYLVAEGRVFLSGVSDGAHWVAEITDHPDGAQGYVSALYFDPYRRSGPRDIVQMSRHEISTSMTPGPRSGSGGTAMRNFQFDHASIEVSALPVDAPPESTAAAAAQIDYARNSVLISADDIPSTAVAVTLSGG